MTEKTILVVGTYDTKDDELTYIAECIRNLGGHVRTMDVSVLGDPTAPCDHSKHDVAQEADSSIEAVIASGDENHAMQIMANGASLLTARLYREGKIDGVIILGGSMGTDLALDVTCALPIGVPKYFVSTVSFSPMIPSDRLAPDVQMILWAGGLYGLNSVCKASLSQAAGAVLGAARAVERPSDAPLIGMTSLGKTALKYMVTLKPALEERGFEVAVFHATGMGGRAFEALAAQGAFACVFDFCTQELGNHVFGSNITSGPDRLTAAGLSGTPQIVAPGCHDLVDLPSWQPLPERFSEHPSHVHNRLITSVVLNTEERRDVARAHAAQLAKAKGPSALILPRGGCGEWDRPGAGLHDPVSLAAFMDAMAAECPDTTKLHVLDAHINDEEFSDTALAIFDAWVADGTVRQTS
ncbi:Tm-1-like ATP-binding domain-containing protein [Ruegeria sp.]|uniref:Tm-1-like ATP-binding domain-containing protein n=1 Tax=Ruegeria sp. TaxID=1879320 RepID=UPI00230B74C2|nr:Tm-1-like ATP-binding domain-containing protein [Ruegeria sp.]MDA7967102.1 Tm-1-like ATP-binding domain-containing protein [Ruegeria sp.]